MSRWRNSKRLQASSRVWTLRVLPLPAGEEFLKQVGSSIEETLRGFSNTMTRIDPANSTVQQREATGSTLLQNARLVSCIAM